MSLRTDIDTLTRIAMATVQSECQDGGSINEAYKEGIKKSAETNVYGAYSPSVYTRRGDGGGLMDKGNLRTRILGGDLMRFEVEIEDWTPGNPDILGSLSWGHDHVSDLVESGTYGPLWPNPMQGTARPYMQSGADMADGDADAAAQRILNHF